MRKTIAPISFRSLAPYTSGAQQGGAEAVAAEGRVHHALEARRLRRLDAEQHEGGGVGLADQAPAGGEIVGRLDRAGELDATAIFSRSTPRLVWLC